MKIVTIFLLLIVAIYAKDLSGLAKYSCLINQSIKDANSTIKKKILQTSLNMVKSKTVVKGSCWDYINRVYKNSNVAKKITILKSKKSGPYAKMAQIQSGDWIYHINHSYKNVGHSGLFIAWVDKNSSKALMLSYAGEGKSTPARFRVYDIDKTYNIIRAKGDNMQDYITLKEYAIKNKISIFNAMKLVKTKKVESITKEVDGKEQVFIKLSSKVPNVQTKEQKEPTIKELMQEIEKLKQRVTQLEKK